MPMSQTYPDPNPHVNLASFALEHFFLCACGAAIRIQKQDYVLGEDVHCYLACFVGVLARTPELRVDLIRAIIGTHIVSELAPHWKSFMAKPENLSELSEPHFNLLADPSLLPN